MTSRELFERTHGLKVPERVLDDIELQFVESIERADAAGDNDMAHWLAQGLAEYRRHFQVL